MISYRPLFVTLAKQGKQLKDLTNDLKISSATVAKLKKGQSVTVETLDRICEYLCCDYVDLVTHVRPEVDHG